MNYIPFSVPCVGEEEIKEVVDSMKSGWLTTGPKVKQFERDFADYLGVKHAIAVNSCTAAVHLSLVACGIGPGDEVITTPMTFVSTPNCIIEVGAVPVFADIDPLTHNIDVSRIEEKITERTRAIIPVHIAGHPCDMDGILKLAGKYNLIVIEDAAHAIAASYKGKKIGTIGNATCFSFYATKNLCTAEGGMVTTENDDLARAIRIYTLHGISRDAYNRYAEGGSWQYEVIVPGYKYNMPDLSAAMGIWQLRKLDGMQSKRREIAAIYNEAFKAVDEIETPKEYGDIQSAWHLYTIRLKPGRLNIDRDEFITELGKRKIGTSVHFIPVHYFPFYKKTFGYNKGDYPVCESVFKRIISLPIYPGLSRSDLDRIIHEVKDIINMNKADINKENIA